MDIADSCIACDVLVRTTDILLHCARRHGYFLQILCLCAPSFKYVIIDDGAASDSTDAISHFYTLVSFILY